MTADSKINSRNVREYAILIISQYANAILVHTMVSSSHRALFITRELIVAICLSYLYMPWMRSL